MYDLRARNLSDQALGAIHDHAQNTVEPTEEQLAMIAEFQRTDQRFFSSEELQDFAGGGPPPVLPPGKTKSQQRGRLMFVETEFTPGSTKGICALCHTGPMLNQTSPFNPTAPPGARIANIGVSERNLLNLPEYTFLIDDGSGNVQAVRLSDPGVPLTNPRPPGVPPPVRSAPGVLRRDVQDSVALGREEDRSVLPRQQREDAGGARRVLRGPVREQPGLPGPAHGAGPGRHGRLSEVTSVRTEG